MGFIESYKHLEKLCSEVLNDDKRISAYIDEMINTPRGSYLVRGWDDDLKQLKHYRRVRNQIAHEPDCTEQNMCEPSDTEWIDDFYSRIMNQTDSLALYAKATNPRTTVKTTKAAQANKSETTSYNRPPQRNNHAGCLTFILCTILIIGIVILITQTI